MSPDDPRHGTTRGFHAGCRQACCERAMRRDDKQRKLDQLAGRPRAIAAGGTTRRLQALHALGWTNQDIANLGPWNHRNDVQRLFSLKWVERKTYRAVRRVYDQLSMQVAPDHGVHRRVRGRAQRLGWAPPLAWEGINIDDPAARPDYGNDHIAGDFIDHAAIERRLAGDRSVRLRRGETAEVTRRALARGMTTADIERILGIKPERYTGGAAA